MARPGDCMICPFECDRCVFHKLRGTPPNVRNKKYKLLLACIRRATLDSFWSRSTNTVIKHRGQVKIGIALSRLVNLPAPCPSPGPLPPSITLATESPFRCYSNPDNLGSITRVIKNGRRFENCARPTQTKYARAEPQINLPCQ
jgi:hypothetical protein